MENLGVIYIAGSKRAIKPCAPKQELEHQYPFLVMAKLASKPKLNLILTDKCLNNARKRMKTDLTEKNVKMDVVKTFLYWYLSAIPKVKLEEEWKSYNIVIGANGSLIGPLDLLEVNTTDGPAAGSGSADEAADQDESIALICLIIYRLIRIENDKHVQTIKTRCNQQLAICKDNLTHNPLEIDCNVELYRAYQNDDQYNKIIAAVDMFFYKFRSLKLSRLRLGTLGSRYRDCDALLSYGLIVDKLNMAKLTDFAHWIWDQQAMRDMDRMYGDGNLDPEILQGDSYFPYQSDLNIVEKTAYSTSLNYSLFSLIHITGCLLGVTRSIHARLVSDNLSEDVFTNASIIAFAFRHSSGLRKQFMSRPDDTIEIDESTVLASEDSNWGTMEKLKGNRDANDWFIWFMQNKGVIPDRINEFIEKRVSILPEPRDGSIAEYCKLRTGQ